MARERSILLRLTADEHADLVARYGYGKVSAGIRAALFADPLPGNQPPTPVVAAPDATTEPSCPGWEAVSKVNLRCRHCGAMRPAH